MDFNAGPTSVFVAKNLIYVTTLKLTSLLLGFVVRLSLLDISTIKTMQNRTR